MKALKVLVLVQHDCVPPPGATISQADWAHWKTEFYVKRTLVRLGHQVDLLPVTEDLSDLKNAIDHFKPNVVFNLLEEFAGNPHFESHIVAYLELLGVAYTGCNPLGLSIGRDKALSKKIVKYHGLPTPEFFTLPIGKKLSEFRLNFPVIVKSLSEEASMGISQDSIVNDLESLKSRIGFIHEKIATSALVEEYIEGREFYVGVLGHKNLKVLPPWELKFGKLGEKSHAIATRVVKFNKDYCERYGIKRGPAQDLSPFEIKKINNISREIFHALKLSGYARLDFRLTAEGQLYFLEANPNAELADKECLANAAHKMGLSYPELIGKILSLAQTGQKAA